MASIAFALLGYALYLRSIIVHHIKPHAFSWFIWGLLAGIAFAAQYVGNAGAGSWVTFADMFLCTIVFVLALLKGEKQYVTFDWVALFFAFVALFLWWLTKQPTLSVILITIVDYCGFLPTFRKSYQKPYQESSSMYVLGSAKYLAAVFALHTYSIDTALYIGALIPVNAALAGMILLRRRSVRPN